MGDARLERRSFDDLPGWADDDHAAALATFRRSCEALKTGAPEGVRQDDLRPACQAALDPAGTAGPAQARRFFERAFEPFEVAPPMGGFLTGYFEPEYDGSLQPDQTFATPLLGRPDDLVSIAAGETLPGLDPGLRAARRTGAGYEPYPDRAAIEDGALGAGAKPIAYVREPAEAFVIQVQGSARLRLRDGRVVRVAYDGRNGQPYTSIGKILVEDGLVARTDMSLERLMDWLKSHPEEARTVMRRNRSYIFFRVAGELDPADGPVGGAGHPLTPGRSLAVDHTLWDYGLPVWLEGRLPLRDGGSEPLNRLMIAQDTGSAIVGPARADYFFGSGPEAGTRAGLLGRRVRFVVLRPRQTTLSRDEGRDASAATPGPASGCGPGSRPGSPQ